MTSPAERRLLRCNVMSKRGRRVRALNSPAGQARRGSSPNEGGLRALGGLMAADESAVRSPGGDACAPVGPGVGATSGVANGTRLAALGEAMARSGKKTRSPRRRRVRRIMFIFLSALLVVVLGAGGYAYYLAHDLNRVDVRGLKGALTTGKEAGTENILMVGSTSPWSFPMLAPRAPTRSTPGSSKVSARW
jgi:hypothetical protein